MSGPPAPVGGVLALDFANTAAGRDAPQPVEHLRSAADLPVWAERAGVLDARPARLLAEAIAADPAGAQALLRAALRLRETIYGIGAAIARRGAPPPAELERLKDFVGEAIVAGRLVRAPGGGYGFDFSAAAPGVALLGPVAWSAVELLARADLRRVRQCPGEGCGWLFLDVSKNGARRWCDMATCGNRAKARRFRARH